MTRRIGCGPGWRNGTADRAAVIVEWMAGWLGEGRADTTHTHTPDSSAQLSSSSFHSASSSVNVIELCASLFAVAVGIYGRHYAVAVGATTHRAVVAIVLIEHSISIRFFHLPPPPVVPLEFCPSVRGGRTSESLEEVVAVTGGKRHGGGALKHGHSFTVYSPCPLTFPSGRSHGKLPLFH